MMKIQPAKKGNCRASKKESSYVAVSVARAMAWVGGLFVSEGAGRVEDEYHPF